MAVDAELVEEIPGILSRKGLTELNDEEEPEELEETVGHRVAV